MFILRPQHFSATCSFFDKRRIAERAKTRKPAKAAAAKATKRKIIATNKATNCRPEPAFEAHCGVFTTCFPPVLRCELVKSDMGV